VERKVRLEARPAERADEGALEGGELLIACVGRIQEQLVEPLAQRTHSLERACGGLVVSSGVNGEPLRIRRLEQAGALHPGQQHLERAQLIAKPLALWCGQASFFFVLALYLQQARGLTPLRSGLVFMIAACAYTAASLRAPMLTARYGRELVAVGALTLALGHASLVLAVHEIGARGDLALLAPGLLLVGAGMGLCITPLTATVLGSADPQQAGAVSGTLSTMQQVGNALGVATAPAAPLSSAWPSSPFS
jgi:Major Facilitator Superfamily